MVNIIQEKLETFLSEGSLKKVLLISSSSNQLDLEKGSYIGGTRETNEFKIISLITNSEKSVKDIIRLNHKNVAHFFVEAEKKLPYNYKSSFNKFTNNSNFSNLFQAAFVELNDLKEINKLSKWKPSDLTVKSAINFIRKWEKIKRPRQISIIGLGNIGSKLALSLVEEGIKIKATNKTHLKGEIICNGINKIISRYTIARVLYYEEIETCVAESDIIINCASSTNFIDPEIFNLMKKPSLFLDIGKNSLSNYDYDTVDTTLLRCDISEEIKKFVTSEINFNNAEIPKMITKKNGSRYIEPGILAKPGDILVKNIENLDNRIGIIDRDLRLNYD